MPAKHLFSVKRARGPSGGSDDQNNYHDDREPRRPSLTAAMGLRAIARRPSKSSSSLALSNKDKTPQTSSFRQSPPGIVSASDSVTTSDTAFHSDSSPTTPAASDGTAQTTPSDSIDYKAHMGKSIGASTSALNTTAAGDAPPGVVVTSASTANLLNPQSSAADIAAAYPRRPSTTTAFPDAPTDPTDPSSGLIADENKGLGSYSRTPSSGTVIHPAQQHTNGPVKTSWAALRLCPNDDARRPSTSPSASPSTLKATSTSIARPEGGEAQEGMNAAMGSQDVVDQQRFPSDSTLQGDSSNVVAPNHPKLIGSTTSVDQSPSGSANPKNKNGVRSRFRWRRRTSDLINNHNNSTSSDQERPLSPPTLSTRQTNVVGFAAANRKRNHAFHQHFRSVPEDDWLIEDYSCALQREILAAGRMYVSEGHICFTSNILGWVTNLVISFEEVTSFEKEMTAMVIPNAISIQTLHGRHTIRSLLSRDATYDLLVAIWKSHRPTAVTDDNMMASDNGGAISESNSDSDYYYDEDEEEADDGGTSQFPEIANPDAPRIAGDNNSASDVSSSNAPASRNGLLAVPPTLQSGNRNATQASSTVPSSTNASVPQMGPATHAPTEFTDPKSRYDRVCKDDIIHAPLGQVFSILFGPSSGPFMSRFLEENQKVLDLQFPDEEKEGLRPETKTTRSYSYIKPLNASVGPKQTKCLLTEQLDFFDLDKAVVVTMSVESPDVPSGNVFVSKTKFVLTWDKNNTTRYFASTGVEWTGKSWFKGLIEKGSFEGQVSFCEDLVKACNASLPRSRTASAPSKMKKRRKQRGSPEKQSQNHEHRRSRNPDTRSISNNSSSGVIRWLSSIRQNIGITSIIDSLQSMSLTHIILVTLLLLLVFSISPIPRFLSSSSSRHTTNPKSASVPDDLGFYDKLWQQQETELWDWLDERMHMTGDPIHESFGSAVYPPLNQKNSALSSSAPLPRSSKGSKGNGARQANEVFHDAVADAVEDGTVNEEEIENAIRVTEERLGDLQRAVTRRKRKVQQQGRS